MVIITKVPKKSNLESFLHKPVIFQGKVVGTVVEVEELPDGYLVLMNVWEKFAWICSEFQDDDLTSMSIVTQ